MLAVAERSVRRDQLWCYSRIDVRERAFRLRERREDIPQLFEHHVLLSAARYKREAPIVTDQLMRDLVSFDWPGNVRELGNVADRFVLGLLGGRFNSDAASEGADRSLKDVV